MRAFIANEVPRDFDHRLVKILRDINGYLQQVEKGMGHISRGYSPTGGGGVPLPAGTIDHNNLLNLTGYDRHTQYAHLPGREAGQVLNGGAYPDITSPGSVVSKGAFTAKNNKTSLSTWSSIAIDTSAAIGDLLIVHLATLPIANADGPTAYHSTLTDTKGNTWTKIREYTYSPEPAFPGNGSTLSAWMCVVTSALTAGADTLTATFSATFAAQALTGRAFTIYGGSPTVVALLYDGNFEFTGVGCTSLTISGLASGVQHLFIRAASEGSAGSSVTNEYTATASFTAFTIASTTGGANNVGAFGEFKIATASSATSDPSGGAAGGYYSSFFYAIGIYTPIAGTLELRSNPLPDSAWAEWAGQYLILRGTTIGFGDIWDSSNKSYVRGSDGAFIGPVIATYAGAQTRKLTTVTAAVTLNDTHDVVLADATSAGFTVTLPASAGCIGRMYTIVKVDTTTNQITVDGNGSELISGATTQDIRIKYTSIDIVSDGTGWRIV